MRRLAPLALTSALAALALALPGTASATAIAGPNGKIVFTSGRTNSDITNPMNDNSARLWVVDWPFGTPVQLTTGAVNVQHRHPNWSPDHTKVVYAASTGANGTAPYELRIKNLVTGSDTLFVAATAGQDRPTWSPDGTRIAYGAGGQIRVKGVAPGSTPITVTSGPTDERAVWSPDGNTLYFNRGTAGNRDIWKVSPVVEGGTETPILDGGTDDWQPAVSPDGSRLCFLRGPQNDGANLRTVGVDGNTEGNLVDDPAKGALNCVWSPDGTTILYTLGAFTSGDLATANPLGGDLTSLTAFSVNSHFDGNADWATNFSPVCDNKNASIGVNQFVVITLGCADPDHTDSTIAPPTRLPLGREEITVNKPGRGNVGGLAEDLKIVYTPPKDFKGTDTFTYSGNDGTSESKPATVTIKVGTGGGGGPGTAARIAKVSRIKLSAKRFRRGPRLPSISKVRVGTTISFNLDTAANVKLSFQQKTVGRRAGSRCVKLTPRNRGKRPCTRFVSKGSTRSLVGKVGLNRVRFQGRLTSSKRLALGTYRVVVHTGNAAGRTKRNGPTFTIVG